VGVEVAVDDGATLETGAGAAGREATGTALWHAATERNPATTTAARICCFVIFCFPYFAINSSSIFSADWYPAVAMCP
jgi:hypothetical protein